VLVVHYPATSTAVLCDVALPGRQPLTSPLPLRRVSRRPAAGRPPGGGAAAAPRYDTFAAAHAPGWVLLMPNLVLDGTSHRLYRLHLDLTAIVDSASDWPALVGFLQRRRPSPAAPALSAATEEARGGGAGGPGGGGAGAAVAGVPGAAEGEPRALLLGVCRAALQEPLELSALAAIFRQLVQVRRPSCVWGRGGC
jgi:hypothetical protein